MSKQQEIEQKTKVNAQIGIGIIGVTGRMGQMLQGAVEADRRFAVAKGFHRSCGFSLDEVFAHSDCVVDFSAGVLVAEVLAAAQRWPRPLLLCSTGWLREDHEEALAAVAAMVPVVIAPNTSVGAVLQRVLGRIAAAVLGGGSRGYDVDIIERHHRHKQDSPSGTALQLAAAVRESRERVWARESGSVAARVDGLSAMAEAAAGTGGALLSENGINVVSCRSGEIPGEHGLYFTGEMDELAIRHTAFNRRLFAAGALRAAGWLCGCGVAGEASGLELELPLPRIYTMEDVIGFSRWAKDI